MSRIIFEWDDEKNCRNLNKHGVSFDEARSVFFDDFAIQYWDEEHSNQEDRFLMLGMSSRIRIILIVHCYRESDSIIRIISARKATKNESKEYMGGRS
jgi:uncharacterized protein